MRGWIIVEANDIGRCLGISYLTNPAILTILVLKDIHSTEPISIRQILDVIVSVCQNLRCLTIGGLHSKISVDRQFPETAMPDMEWLLPLAALPHLRVLAPPFNITQDLPFFRGANGLDHDFLLMQSYMRALIATLPTLRFFGLVGSSLIVAIGNLTGETEKALSMKGGVVEVNGCGAGRPWTLFGGIGQSGMAALLATMSR